MRGGAVIRHKAQASKVCQKLGTEGYKDNAPVQTIVINPQSQATALLRVSGMGVKLKTANGLDLTHQHQSDGCITTDFLYLACGDIGFKKNPRLSIGL